MKHVPLVYLAFTLIGFALVAGSRMPRRARPWLWGTFFLFLFGEAYYTRSPESLALPVSLAAVFIAERFASRADNEPFASESLVCAGYVFLRIALDWLRKSSLISWLGHPHPGASPLTNALSKTTMSFFGMRGWQPTGLSLAHWPFLAQMLVALLAYEFAYYWRHRAQHAFHWWWKLHRTHHAPKHLEALVFARTHLLQFLFLNTITTFGTVFLFDIRGDAAYLGGFLPALVVGNIWGHANIDFPRRALPKWAYAVILPNAHALHHTKTGDRCNYGNTLLIWDMIFGTFRAPPLASTTPFQFGVEGWTSPGGVFPETFDLRDQRES